MSHKYTDFQNSGTSLRVSRCKNQIGLAVLSVLWMLNQKGVKKFIRKNFFKPKRYRISGQEAALLKKAAPFTIKVNDQTIAAWRWENAGPTLIFVHGWNGCGIQFYAFIRESLKRGYAVVTFDGPGHGASGGDSSSYFEMSDALRGILSRCRGETIAAVIGHSFGAAAIINALHKDRYRIPAVLIAPALGIKEILENTFQLHGIPAHISRNLIRSYEEQFGYDLEKDNPKNLLKQFTLRALIVHDKDDRVTLFNESEITAAASTTVELLPTTGLGHKKIVSDRQVIGQVLNYLRQPEFTAEHG